LFLAQFLGELGRGGEDDFVFNAAGEGYRIEVFDRADAKGRQGLFETALALQISRALLAFKALSQVFGRFGRRHS